jgi:hypothetical protein
MSEFNKALIIFFVGLVISLACIWAIYTKMVDYEQAQANNKTAEACRKIVERSNYNVKTRMYGMQEGM